MSDQISKREGKVGKDGAGYKVYIKPEEAEKLGIKPGDSVDVVVNPEGTLTVRAAAPPNLYEKFLQNAIEGGVEFGDPIEVGDAFIIPIMTKNDQVPPRDYVTVPEALAMGNLRFNDTGGISGVHVTNTGNVGVLVVQGQVLEGGTQPRTIITNMILAPNQDIVLPARCVHSTRPIEAGAKMTIAGMAPRTVAFSLMQPQFKVDQHRVWGDIRCVAGTCVAINSMFAQANVSLNTAGWAQSNDLSEVVHSCGDVAMFTMQRVDQRVKKWVSK